MKNTYFGIINFGIYPRNKGREGFKIKGMFKNLFQNMAFLEFYGSVLESKEAFGIRIVKWGLFLPFKDKK